MTPTGTRNSPASPEGQGLEVDKMNRAAAQDHFDAFIGQLLKRMPAAERKAFKHVVADSYEMGSQNWTDGFAAHFPAALRLRSDAVAAGADRPRRRQRGSDRTGSCGTCGGWWPTASPPITSAACAICASRTGCSCGWRTTATGVSRRVPAIRRPVGPHRRRVLGHGRPRLDRVPRRLLGCATPTASRSSRPRRSPADRRSRRPRRR